MALGVGGVPELLALVRIAGRVGLRLAIVALREYIRRKRARAKRKARGARRNARTSSSRKR